MAFGVWQTAAAPIDSREIETVGLLLWLRALLHGAEKLEYVPTHLFMLALLWRQELEDLPVDAPRFAPAPLQQIEDIPIDILALASAGVLDFGQLRGRPI